MMSKDEVAVRIGNLEKQRMGIRKLLEGSGENIMPDFIDTIYKAVEANLLNVVQDQKILLKTVQTWDELQD